MAGAGEPARLPLVLCNVSVADVPLSGVIPAAARAGFDAITIVGGALRRSIERDGIGPDELAAMVREHGLTVTDVEAVGDWWRPLPTDSPTWLQPGFDEAEFLDVATTFGAVNLVATHFGTMGPLDEAAVQFARLCDAAAERSLMVAFEYPAMATVDDVATAWTIVRLADRANGGILHDVWHHDRSPATDAQLDEVPADRFFSIQLSDASAERRGPPIEDARHRRLIGEGDLDVVEGLRHLVARGVRCPIGIEVFVSFDRRPVDVRVREFADNLRWAATQAGLAV